jgi:ketosteroid isomerase-like protein
MTQRPSPSRRICYYGSLLAILAAFALTLPACAKARHPRSHDHYKHQVEKLEDAWRAAQLNSDVAAMDQLLSDDYVGITMSGQVVTKMQQLDRIKNRATMLDKYELTDMKVKLMGTTAVVTSLAEVEGTNDGQPIHGTFRSTRVYTRLASGVWKVTNYEATRVGPPLRPAASSASEDHEKP